MYCNTFIVSRSADCHARYSIYNEFVLIKGGYLSALKLKPPFYRKAETVVHLDATETLWEHHIG